MVVGLQAARVFDHWVHPRLAGAERARAVGERVDQMGDRHVGIEVMADAHRAGRGLLQDAPDVLVGTYLGAAGDPTITRLVEDRRAGRARARQRFRAAPSGALARYPIGGLPRDHLRPGGAHRRGNRAGPDRTRAAQRARRLAPITRRLPQHRLPGLLKSWSAGRAFRSCSSRVPDLEPKSRLAELAVSNQWQADQDRCQRSARRMMASLAGPAGIMLGAAATD